MLQHDGSSNLHAGNISSVLDTAEHFNNSSLFDGKITLYIMPASVPFSVFLNYLRLFTIYLFLVCMCVCLGMVVHLSNSVHMKVIKLWGVSSLSIMQVPEIELECLFQPCRCQGQDPVHQAWWLRP